MMTFWTHHPRADRMVAAALITCFEPGRPTPTPPLSPLDPQNDLAQIYVEELP